MNKVLAHRLHTLEEAWDKKLLATWQGLSLGEQLAVLDAATRTLIQQGVLPPPDPTRPDASMDVLRREPPDTFRQWHQAYLGNRDWHQRHPEAVRMAIAALAASLREPGTERGRQDPS